LQKLSHGSESKEHNGEISAYAKPVGCAMLSPEHDQSEAWGRSASR
jgi:hypothetical protein